MKYRAKYAKDGERTIATIEDYDGWYVCDTEQCSDESRQKCEKRVGSLVEALVRFGALVTTRPVTKP